MGAFITLYFLGAGNLAFIALTGTSVIIGAAAAATLGAAVIKKYNRLPSTKKRAVALAAIATGSALALISDDQNEFSSVPETTSDFRIAQKDLLQTPFRGFDGAKYDGTFCKYTTPLNPTSSIDGVYNVVEVNLKSNWVEFSQGFGDPSQTYDPNYKIKPITISLAKLTDFHTGEPIRNDLAQKAMLARQACSAG